MDLYSWTLLAALICGALGLAARVLALFAGRPPWTPYGRGLGALSLVLVGFSMSWHAVEGHGPESAEPLGFFGLLVAHPVAVVVALGAVVVLAWPGRRGV